MIAFIILVLSFLVSGTIFALPAFIPALRQRARQSPQFKKMLITTLSVITFVLFFIGMTYLGAKVSRIFGAMGSCYSGFDCGGGEIYFWDDAERDALLTRELWLQGMLPPLALSETTCLTGDLAVCDATREIRKFSFSNNQTAGYILILLLLLIPATVCGFTVRNITRDNRKEKAKLPD